MENNREEGNSSSERSKSLGSSRSKRKPTVVTKYVGSDDEQTLDETVNEDVSNENSENDVDMKSLPKGTVVVQPEPVLNEDKDDFKGPEFRSRNTVKMKPEAPKKRGEEGLHGIVSCTACGQQVNHFQKDSIYRHPTLKVLICKTCYKYYMSDDISRDSDGMDEQCRWCAEGGNLICCDFCHNAFCKKCILRNLGRKELSTIMDENNQWHCYICQPEPLLDLVTACDSVFENLEQLLQQNKKKIKVESEKSKIYDHAIKFSPKRNSSNCNGEEKKIDDSYSGSLTYSYKALMVPKDLLKKAKKLVETTTNMNASFVNFLKKATENSEINPTVQVRQLKAFKSVLSDIKKAHQVLEEGLNLEIQALDAKIKEKNTKEKKNETRPEKMEMKKKEVKEHADLKEKDIVKPEEKIESAQSDNEPMDQSVPATEQTENKNASSEDKRSDTNAEPQYEPNSTEALDMDIVSVPTSVPEDIFETLESAMEIQTASEEQGSRSAAAEQETLNANIKSNTPLKDTKGGPKLKASAKVTKELFVKLTPVSLSDSPVKTEDQEGSLEKEAKNVDAISKAENCDSGKENHDAGNECLPQNDAVLLIEESDLRRSPRVKTTPLRRQTDVNPLTSNSEEDSNDTGNEKRKQKSSSQSKRKQDKRNSSDKTIDSPKPSKLSKSKKSNVLDQSSDSDEMPAVLKKVAMLSRSSSEIDSNTETPQNFQKITNDLKKQSKKDESGKRKRRSSSSGSDLDSKRGKSTKDSTSAKKKRQNYSDSSNYDSELEREIKSLSKIESAKKAKKKYSRKEDSYDSSEEEQSKKGTSSKKKKKINVKKQQDESSNDESENSSPEKEEASNFSEDKKSKGTAIKEKKNRDLKQGTSTEKQDDSSEEEQSKKGTSSKKKKKISVKKQRDESSNDESENSSPEKEEASSFSEDKKSKGTAIKEKKNRDLKQGTSTEKQDDSSEEEQSKKGTSSKKKKKINVKKQRDESSNDESENSSPEKEEASNFSEDKKSKGTAIKEKKNRDLKQGTSTEKQDDSSEEEQSKKGTSSKKKKKISVKKQRDESSNDESENSSPEKEDTNNFSEDKKSKRTAIKEKKNRDLNQGTSTEKQDELLDLEKSNLEKTKSCPSEGKNRTQAKEKKNRELKKKKAQDDSSSDGAEKAVKKEQNCDSSEDKFKNEKATESEEKKSENLKKKRHKKEQNDSSSDAEKSSPEKDGYNSSENNKSKNEKVVKKRRNLRERITKRAQIDSSSDAEQSRKKRESSSDDDKRNKRVEAKEKKKISHKKKASKKEHNDSLSSSDEESYEDDKKKSKRGSTKESKKGNLKEKKRISKKQKDLTSSSSDEEESDDQKSTGDGSSDEQKIVPVTEDLMMSFNTGFCQSSGDEGETKSGAVPMEEEEDDDDPENRIAKKMLLEEIKANLSSDEDASSDEEPAEGKKRTGKQNENTGDDEENEKEENSESDSDDEESKKPRYRHRLLRHKLTVSDGESGEEKKRKSKDTKEGKRRNRRKVSSDGSNDSEFHESEVSEEVSESEDDQRRRTRSSKKAEAEENRSYKQKKKRRRIKVQEDSSSENKSNSDEEENDDSKSPGKGRKKIRKIIKDDKLRTETQNALKEEEERRKRIAEREREREKLREVIEIEDASPLKCPITTKLVLDEDEETKEPLVQVNRHIVTKLKPHQVDGVQFMWDCCCESVKKTKTSPGSGCILAHCMGLGKTLQVVSFLHTVLLCDKLDFSTALVVCPLNTALNWLNEFEKWQDGLEDDEQLEVCELATVKRPQERGYMLQRWQEEGGVMIIGYEMYRNLAQGRNVKSRKLKEIYNKALVDPGPDFVVCDEGHILKNEASAVSKAMNAIQSRRRIILTGTPLQNNLIEYHCMVNFIKENLLGSIKEFRNRFINPIQNGQCADSTPVDVRVMKKRAHILYEMLAGCVQRKDYTALTKFLPPKHEYVLAVRMTPLQCKLYQFYLDHLTGVGSGEGGRGKAGAKLFQDFQMLSRIWTHPWCLQLDYISKENKGYFDEDSLDDFIASDSDETSMSLSSDDYAKKKKSKGKKAKKESSPSGSGSGSDNDVEVIKVWNSRSRGGGEGNTEDLANTPAIPAKSDEGKATSSSNPGSPAPDWYKDFVTDADAEILEHSGKMVLLLEILRMAEELGDKVLVFSQSLISLDLIEDFLELASTEKTDKEKPIYKGEGKWFRNIDYYRLDGSTTAQSRKKWAEEFNDETNVRGRLFIISTKAGSLGINLVAANRVIIFDASWNPSYDIQSIFRVYRFGQNKPVFVYRFLAQGTMEDKIYDRQVTKQSLSFRVVDQQQVERHFTMNELTELYTFEPDLLDDPNSEKKKKRDTPMLPKDTILAELLQIHKEHIVGYHEHDSLLDHKEEEELTEEERKAAWAEYEAEKKGLTMRFNMPAGTNMPHVNYNTQTPYIPFNLGALSAMSNQQLEDLINQGREKVVEATNNVTAARIQPLEDIISAIWKDNVTLTESQVQALALSRQASQELDVKRREAMYNDVLTKQQMLISCVQRILMNRRLQQQYNQQQQQQMSYQQAAMSHLMMPKPPNLIMNPSNYQQIDMRGMYQSVSGGMQPPPLQRAPPPMRGKNPGPSQGK
ncbi:transcriptional regulator ATRX isoform X2 [Alligator sinensis]|uniref:Transcriptional regulator ATRX n=1 Tax=Alligator sinensis TaxID=38654 RepID=A0A3Q0HF30_ALLSI|nr:transcriptional regulator ATRX isoform X2 [Alligator sinensis]